MTHVIVDTLYLVINASKMELLQIVKHMIQITPLCVHNVIQGIFTICQIIHAEVARVFGLIAQAAMVRAV